MTARFDADSADVAESRRLTRETTERRLRRRLRGGELHVDQLAIDTALERGKARLREAIELEKRRALRRFARGGSYRPVLDLTDEMQAALVALFDAGRREALAEIDSIGVQLPEQWPAVFARDEPMLDALMAGLRVRLSGLSIRIERAAVVTDLTGLGVEGIVRELDRKVPGALDAASRLVSGAFDLGLGDVFGQADQAGLFTGWIYSAMMDEATCEECDANDGEEYDSWDAIQAVLPDGGPNPNCYGNGRCRCRAVPADVAVAA